MTPDLLRQSGRFCWRVVTRGAWKGKGHVHRPTDSKIGDPQTAGDVDEIFRKLRLFISRPKFSAVIRDHRRPDKVTLGLINFSLFLRQLTELVPRTDFFIKAGLIFLK